MEKLELLKVKDEKNPKNDWLRLKKELNLIEEKIEDSYKGLGFTYQGYVPVR
jgi:hypothetical protein